MYTGINGIFENGQVILEEAPPTTQKTRVVVMFMNEDVSHKSAKRTPGSLKRLGELMGKKFSLPENFNEPLDDLKEYM
jgi:hypothetical protein